MAFAIPSLISIGLGVAIKLLFPPAPIKRTGPRVSDRSIRGSTYGKRIRYVEGLARIGEEDSNIIHSTGLIERAFTTKDKVGGIFGLGGQTIETTEFKYFHSSMYMVCEGPIQGMPRLWFNKKLRLDKSGSTRANETSLLSGLVDFSILGDGANRLAQTLSGPQGTTKIRIYLGGENQQPDPFFEAQEGVGNVSAHRGWALVVVEEQELGDFGNQIPRLSAEVAGSIRDLFPRQNVVDPDDITAPWSGPGGVEINAMYLDPFEDIISHAEQGGSLGYGRLSGTSLTALSAVTIAFNPGHQVRVGFLGIDNKLLVRTTGGNNAQLDVMSLIDGSLIRTLQDATGEADDLIPNGIGSRTMPFVVRAPGFGEKNHYIVAEGFLIGEGSTALNIYDDDIRLMQRTDLHISSSAIWRGFIFNPFNDGRIVWAISDTATTVRLIEIEVMVSIGANPLLGPSASFSDPVPRILKDYSIPGDIPSGSGPLLGWCIVDAEDAIILGFTTFIMKVSMEDGTILATNTDGIGFDAPYNWTDTDKFAFLGADAGGATTNHLNVYEMDVTDLSITKITPVSSWFSDDSQSSLILSASSTYDPRSDSLVVVRPESGAFVPDPNLARIFLSRFGGNSVPLDEVMGRLDGRAGLNISTQSDRAQLVNDEVRWSTAAASIREAVEELTAVFRFEGVESDAKMKWIKRGNAPVITIPAADIGLIEDEEQLEETLRDESEVASRYTLIYPDAKNDYQVGVQHSVRNLGPDETIGTRREVEEETDVVLEATEARQLTEIKLYTASGERRGVKFNVLWTYLALDPTDVIVLMVPRAGGSTEALNIRISDITYGADMVMEITAVVENARTFTSTTAGFAGEFNVPTVIILRPSTFLALNLPLLRDGDATFQQASRSYWTILAQIIAEAVFPGATGLVSSDNRTFQTIASLGLEPAVGTILTALPDPTYIDGWNEDSVTIEMQSGIDRIVTQLEDDILNDDLLNLAAVFKANGTVELIRIQNITQINSGRITAQRMLRGRRGTDPFATSHGALERIVFLERNRFGDFQTAIDDINRTFTYKALTIGTELEDARGISATYTGEDLKPYAPVNVTCVAQANGDFLLNGTRRTRFGGGVGSDDPLNEAEELYEADIIEKASGTILGTFQMDSLTNVTITKNARDVAGAGIPDPASGINLNIVNPGAETGDKTGWTNIFGGSGVEAGNTPNPPGPRTGSFFWTRTGGFNEGWRMEQTISIDPADFPMLDIGRNGYHFEWYQSADATNDDTGRCEIIFLDGNEVELGRGTATTIATTPDVWTLRTLIGKVPPLTRSVTIAMQSVSHVSVTSDAYFDDLNALFSDQVLAAVETDELQCIIYQISAIVGRGRPSELIDIVGNQ
jgi:hypothetical protein